MREHSPPLTKQLNLVVFSDLYFWFHAKLMFKVVHHMLPKCTVSMFTRLSNVVNVNIRQADYNFYLPRVRLNASKNLLHFQECCASQTCHTLLNLELLLILLKVLYIWNCHLNIISVF